MKIYYSIFYYTGYDLGVAATGGLLHAPLMNYTDANLKRIEYEVSNAVITEDLNFSGVLDLTVPATHPNNKEITIGTIIEITATAEEPDNSSIGAYRQSCGSVTWCGRTISMTVDMWGNKQLTVEGPLGFLKDFLFPKNGKLWADTTTIGDIVSFFLTVGGRMIVQNDGGPFSNLRPLISFLENILVDDQNAQGFLNDTIVNKGTSFDYIKEQSNMYYNGNSSTLYDWLKEVIDYNNDKNDRYNFNKIGITISIQSVPTAERTDSVQKPITDDIMLVFSSYGPSSGKTIIGEPIVLTQDDWIKDASITYELSDYFATSAYIQGSDNHNEQLDIDIPYFATRGLNGSITYNGIVTNFSNDRESPLMRYGLIPKVFNLAEYLDQDEGLDENQINSHVDQVMYDFTRPKITTKATVLKRPGGDYVYGLYSLQLGANYRLYFKGYDAAYYMEHGGSQVPSIDWNKNIFTCVSRKVDLLQRRNDEYEFESYSLGQYYRDLG